MKRRVLLPLAGLLCTTGLLALDNLMLTFKYGPTDLAGNLSFNKHTLGLDFTIDTASNLKPRIDMSYLLVDEQNGGVDFTLQFSANALYEGSEYYGGSILPYLYGGLGYEYVHNERPGFESSPYVQAAVGLEFPFFGYRNEDFKWITEVRWMQMVGGNGGQESEAAIFAGFRIGTGGLGVHESDYSENRESSYAEFEGVQTPELVAQRALFSDTDGDGVADKDDKCPHTPRGEVVDEMGCSDQDRALSAHRPRPMADRQRKKKVTFQPLPNQRKLLTGLFESDSTKLSPAGRKKILDFVKWINKRGYRFITVEGYTDNSGTYAQNVALSKKRAEVVKKLMIQYGIDSQKIAAVGKGSLNPIASNDLPQGRALNRRIEIVFE